MVWLGYPVDSHHPGQKHRAWELPSNRLVLPNWISRLSFSISSDIMQFPYIHCLSPQIRDIWIAIFSQKFWPNLRLNLCTQSETHNIGQIWRIVGWWRSTVNSPVLPNWRAATNRAPRALLQLLCNTHQFPCFMAWWELDICASLYQTYATVILSSQHRSILKKDLSLSAAVSVHRRVVDQGVTACLTGIYPHHPLPTPLTTTYTNTSTHYSLLLLLLLQPTTCYIYNLHVPQHITHIYYHY